jgi:hypothetical protein
LARAPASLPLGRDRHLSSALVSRSISSPRRLSLLEAISLEAVSLERRAAQESVLEIFEALSEPKRIERPAALVLKA